MKNKLIDSKKLSGNIHKVTIELIPENEIEKLALEDSATNQGSSENKQSIINYLLFDIKNIGNYAFISELHRDKNLFTIEILLT